MPRARMPSRPSTSTVALGDLLRERPRVLAQRRRREVVRGPVLQVAGAVDPRRDHGRVADRAFELLGAPDEQPFQPGGRIGRRGGLEALEAVVSEDGALDERRGDRLAARLRHEPAERARRDLARPGSRGSGRDARSLAAQLLARAEPDEQPAPARPRGSGPPSRASCVPRRSPAARSPPRAPAAVAPRPRTARRRPCLPVDGVVGSAGEDLHRPPPYRPVKRVRAAPRSAELPGSGPARACARVLRRPRGPGPAGAVH